MPFLKFDEGAFDSLPEEMTADMPKEHSGDFEYSPAEAQLDECDLEAQSLVVLEALKGLGAKRLDISYDGGHDEGFAYFDGALVGAAMRDSTSLAADLARLPIVQREREKAKSVRHRAWLAEMTDAKLAEHLLDELAHELASKILGDGYGTGEYELYGSFRVDLTTGLIMDNPNATRRGGGLGR